MKHFLQVNCDKKRYQFCCIIASYTVIIWPSVRSTYNANNFFSKIHIKNIENVHTKVLPSVESSIICNVQSITLGNIFSNYIRLQEESECLLLRNTTMLAKTLGRKMSSPQSGAIWYRGTGPCTTPTKRELAKTLAVCLYWLLRN